MCRRKSPCLEKYLKDTSHGVRDQGPLKRLEIVATLNIQLSLVATVSAFYEPWALPLRRIRRERRNVGATLWAKRS